MTESLVKHSPLLRLSLAADPVDVPEEMPCSFAWKCPKELEWEKKVGFSEKRCWVASTTMLIYRLTSKL